MRTGYTAIFLFAAASLPLWAQTAPANNPPQQKTAAPIEAPRKVDKAAAYYHYSLAHMYEELAATYQQSEFANRAVEEYKLAIENDPASGYLDASLAELYAKTGRIRDAVLEAQDILQRDPNNVEAHKLLGRIYMRSLGDTQGGTQSSAILHKAIEQYQAIVKLQPQDVEDRLYLGRLYRLNNETAKAEAEFRSAVAQDPDSEEAVTALALLYNEQGNSKSALEVLNSIPEGSRGSKVYEVLGYTYEQQKDYKKAIDAYQKSLDLDKDNLDSTRGLAQNLLNDNQADKALEQYRIIVDADPNDAQSYLRISEILRRQGKFDQALEALKKAQAAVPDWLEVPYDMALVYEAQGRYDDALQILQDLVKKTAKADNNYSSSERNNRSIFLAQLGNVYRDTNQPALALAAYRQMLPLGEDAASRGYQKLIETYRDQKQWSDATATAKEAVAKLPKDRTLKLVLAGQLADDGHPDEGIAMARGLLKGTPDDREVYIALAQVESRLKRWSDAEQSIAKANSFATKQEEKDFDSFLLGSLYERQKKYEEAEGLFKKVVSSDPTNADALNYLGYMLADRGVRVEEGLGYLKRAVQLDPQNGAYLDSLGWAYFKLGNYDLAEANLRRAAERTINDPTILDHLGELYEKTGRLKLAAAQWERAVAEWNKTVPSEVDTDNLAKVQKKLESAKVKLARQQGDRKAEAMKPQ